MKDILARLSQSGQKGFAFRQECMAEISQIAGYDWSGIYRLEGDTLVLDAFVGAPTEHDRILVGVGVCGTAVATGENQVIEDVNSLDNYLSCSISTKSEIVVLIRDAQETSKILGQIDIDGHEVRRFKAEDEAFLMDVARLIAERW